MRHVINWIISTLAVFIAAMLLPGVTIASIWTAFVVAVVLGVVNTFIRPIILILTLPINILSLGLFTLVINAGLVLLTAEIIDGFVVNNFWWALLFGFAVSIVNAVLHRGHHNK